MTEAQRAELLALAQQMRRLVRPGDTMDGLWEWIFEIEFFVQGKETLLPRTPASLLADAQHALHRRTPGGSHGP